MRRSAKKLPAKKASKGVAAPATAKEQDVLKRWIAGETWAAVCKEMGWSHGRRQMIAIAGGPEAFKKATARRNASGERAPRPFAKKARAAKGKKAA